MKRLYLANAPSLGHIPCFDECWRWTIDLMLHHWRTWKEITICHLFWKSFIWSYAQEIYPLKLWLWRFFHWSFQNFEWRFVYWRFFLWRFIHWRFFLEKLRFFFFFWRVILKIYPLNIWKFKKKKIYSCWFFLWNIEIFPRRLIQEIFPLQFWKTLMKICP